VIPSTPRFPSSGFLLAASRGVLILPPCKPSASAVGLKGASCHAPCVTTTGPRASFLQLAARPQQGAAEKIKRENDVHLRQELEKKSTYVPFLFFIFFNSTFLGASRQGEFENTRKKIEYVSKKKSPGKIFSGGVNFF
jgi:hypothetical protein